MLVAISHIPYLHFSIKFQIHHSRVLYHVSYTVTWHIAHNQPSDYLNKAKIHVTYFFLNQQNSMSWQFENFSPELVQHIAVYCDVLNFRKKKGSIHDFDTLGRLSKVNVLLKMC